MSLRVDGLHRPRLDGPLSFTLARGEVTGLIGPNGAGKTTLLRALAGITEGPGDVSLDGGPLGALPRAVRARRIAYMPATREVDWPLAVADVVRLGLLPFGPDSGEVDAALERTGTAAFLTRPIDTLSTGERARVLLARTIVGTPDVLLLDEPMANLDPLHRIEVEALLRAEAARGAVVFVSIHDLDHAERCCDQLVLVDRGQLVAAGAPAGVLSETNLAGVFGIRRTPFGWQSCEATGTAL